MRVISKKAKLLLAMVVTVCVVSGIAAYLSTANIDVLNPKGTIASQEKDLIVKSVLLMALVVIPVYILTFAIAWKYREGNKKAKYSPDWDHSPALETIWWAVPTILILVLSVMTWSSSHSLDPFKPLVSNKKPLTVQVVALQWKWLFIYPEQHIASVNMLEMPVDRPVNFQITADAPMNSFWIPSLGGQIYAMSGMSTKLHLMASETGEYNGSSANISGRGFAGMNFIARATSQADFDNWVSSNQKILEQLDLAAYTKLSAPSENNAVSFYTVPENNLYDYIIAKFLVPKDQLPGYLSDDHLAHNHGGN
jgi:cytochrome o ubiquinol oxidase subunit II